MPASRPHSVGVAPPSVYLTLPALPCILLTNPVEACHGISGSTWHVDEVHSALTHDNDVCSGVTRPVGVIGIYLVQVPQALAGAQIDLRDTGTLPPSKLS